MSREARSSKSVAPRGQGLILEFPPFHLDLRGEQLWQGGDRIRLRPRTFQLLRYMAERPGRLLSREALLAAIWGDLAVTPANLNQAILELRRVLGDDAREPRFIQTVHRKGFRFVAPVGRIAARGTGTHSTTHEGVRIMEGPRSLHGREGALELLEARLAEAAAGRRQVVFVTGDAGFGKTSLLRAFGELHAADEAEGQLLLVWGQCVGRRSQVESFHPILDALDRLSRRQVREPWLHTMKHLAPTWLVPLPWLLGGTETETLRRELGAVAVPRMMREFCQLMDAVAREQPLVLLLEDLHWSDPATVDLLGVLAERTEPARLLLVVTYRSAEAAVSEHPIAPLRRRLERGGMSRGLALQPLSKREIEGYLRERFEWLEAPVGLAGLIESETDGSPLFMITLVGQLVSKGLVRRTADGWRLQASIESLAAQAPESLQELVGDLLTDLDASQRALLETASVAGRSFTGHAVAAGLGLEPQGVEEACGRLARGGWFIDEQHLEPAPEGAVVRRFAFKHEAFRRILYRGLPPTTRERVHGRVGESLEADWAEDLDDRAVELATHFEQGGRPLQAIEHLARAARVALRRFAPRDAAGHLRRALGLLSRTPEDVERNRRELDLCFDLARCVAVGGGWRSPELESSLARSLELSEILGDTRTRAFTLNRMVRRHSLLSDYVAAEALVEELLPVAEDVESPALLIDATFQSGLLALRAGQLDRAEEAFSRALAGEVDSADLLAELIFNPTAIAWGARGYCSWLRGLPGDAWAHTRRGAAESEHSPGSPAGVAVQGIRIELGRLTGSPDEVRAGLERHRELSSSSGHVSPSPVVIAGEGWLLAEAGEIDTAIAHLRDGLQRVARGMTMWTSSLHAMLAEARLAGRDAEAGLRGIEEALEYCATTGERAWVAELHRLEGELHLLEENAHEAQAHFEKALEVSRAQGARSLELRASTSLARAWHRAGKATRARRLLQPLLETFAQGRGTRDLLAAARVLETL